MKLELSSSEMMVVLLELVEKERDPTKKIDLQQVADDILGDLLGENRGHAAFLARNPSSRKEQEAILRQSFYEVTDQDSTNYPYNKWPVVDRRGENKGDIVVLTAELPEGRKILQSVEKGVHMGTIRRRAGLVVMHSETPVHDFQVANISIEEALEAGAVQPLAFIKFG